MTPGARVETQLTDDSNNSKERAKRRMIRPITDKGLAQIVYDWYDAAWWRLGSSTAERHKETEFLS